MKKHNGLRLLTAIVLLAAASASAQTNRIKIKVPFDFYLGNISLPAGEYQVDKTSDLRNQLVFSRKGSPGVFVGYDAAETLAASSRTELVFHRYGTTYFLYQVWVEGEHRGQQLQLTRLEKETASKDLAGNVGLAMVEILAEKKVRP
jgi:hypothetical protein